MLLHSKTAVACSYLELKQKAKTHTDNRPLGALGTFFYKGLCQMQRLHTVAEC